MSISEEKPSPGGQQTFSSRAWKASLAEKLSSRTFLLTLVWTFFVPAAFLLRIALPQANIPLEPLITLSGSIALAYVGGEKARDTFAIRNNRSPYDPPAGLP